MLKIIDKTKSIYTKPLREQVIFELLLNDLAMENPQKKDFISYLESLSATSSHLNQEYRMKVSQKVSHGIQLSRFPNFNLNGWNQNTLIDEYIKSLFKNAQDHKDLLKGLTPFIELKMLNRNSILTRLARG